MYLFADEDVEFPDEVLNEDSLGELDSDDESLPELEDEEDSEDTQDK